jgi:mannose-6-phosphate isomerase-like protein (cupin superfamily)
MMSDFYQEDPRPWGYFVILSDQPDHKVKRIAVYPGHRLSLQRHKQRTEHWFIVDGEAIVTRDDENVELSGGQAIDIPQGAWHRIKNPGKRDLVLIEIQTGKYFGEEDIERKEDDYGRTP